MRAIKVLKYILTVGLLAAACVRAHDIEDQELTRRLYPHYEVNDIFGAAQLIKHVLVHSQQLKELLRDPMDLLRATFVVGSIAALVRMSLLGVQGLSARVPDWAAKCFKRCASWCMQLFGWPEGFDYGQLIMWTQMFEQIMAVWCDQKGFGPEREHCLAHWDYQRRFMQDVLYQFISFLESHQVYYRAQQVKRGGVMTTHLCDNRIDHVCFLVQSILRSLQHLIVVSEQTTEPSAFNLEHVKKVACNIVILLQNLCIIISGDPMQSVKQSEYTFSGQAFLPTSHVFDV